MTLRKKFSFFAIVLFIVLAGTSTYCFAAEDCECDTICDGIFDKAAPPCMDITFKGIQYCCEFESPLCDPPPDHDKTFKLEGGGGTCSWVYDDQGGGGDGYLVTLNIVDGVTTVTYDWWDYPIFLSTTGSMGKEGGSAESDWQCCWSSQCENWGEYGAYKGTAEYTPDWNCDDNCCSNLPDYNKTVKVDHEDCCVGGGGTGETITFTMACAAADYVIPSHSGEGDVVKKIKMTPSVCCQSPSVEFTIETQPGKQKTTVTLTAVFYKHNDCEQSQTATLEIIPCGDCCEKENIPNCNNIKLATL